MNTLTIMDSHRKALTFDDLVKKVRELQACGLQVVQSHGIFDLIHPGILAHLKAAKEQGDVLIVTVIRDRDVRRGPGRPIFPEAMRLESVVSLEYVDYACLVEDELPLQCVKTIKPDIFAKGQAYKERDRAIQGRLFQEEKAFYFGKSKIHETEGFSFSSSQIVKELLDIYPDDTRQFLCDFSEQYSFQNLVDRIEELHDLNILLIGDGIIDEYCYCLPMGRSAKSPLVVNKYITQEVFAGGAFAIANHLASVCDRVHLVSLLGVEDSREEFVRNCMKPNVKTKLFFMDDNPSVVKRRYINQYRNQKLFEVNYVFDRHMEGRLERDVDDYLQSIITSYDIILISDFGHGLITEKIIDTIKRSQVPFAVNTQTNGANAGYNMITKYRRPTFVCLDEAEVRLAAQDRFGAIEDVAQRVASKVNCDQFIVTLGKRGSLAIDRDGQTVKTPIFSTKVVDTVGAGDAFFAFTVPCVAKGMPLDLVSFVGNAVGALAVQTVCNKKAVEKFELLEFIHALLA